MKYLLLVLVASFVTPTGISALDCATASQGWHVYVCRRKTTADSIRVYIGLGGNASTHEVWGYWKKQSTVDNLLVPSRYRYTREVWIRGEAMPDGREVHMCVGYDERTTRKMTFNHGEEHEVSWDDNENCDC